MGTVKWGLNLLVNFFMCTNPVVSWFALTPVWGVSPIANAITLLLAERWPPAKPQLRQTNVLFFLECSKKRNPATNPIARFSWIC